MKDKYSKGKRYNGLCELQSIGGKNITQTDDLRQTLPVKQHYPTSQPEEWQNISY